MCVGALYPLHFAVPASDDELVRAAHQHARDAPVQDGEGAAEDSGMNND